MSMTVRTRAPPARRPGSAPVLIRLRRLGRLAGRVALGPVPLQPQRLVAVGDAPRVLVPQPTVEVLPPRQGENVVVEKGQGGVGFFQTVQGILFGLGDVFEEAAERPDRSLPCLGPLGDRAQIDECRLVPRLLHQVADQVDGLELGVGDIQARRVAEEVEDRPVLDGPLHAEADRPSGTTRASSGRCGRRRCR